MDQIFDQFGSGLPLGDGDAWPEVERAPVSIAVPWTEPASGSRDHCRRHAFPSRPNRGLARCRDWPRRHGLAVVSSLLGRRTDGPIFVWLEETDAPTAQHATDMAGVPEHKWTMVWQTRLDGKTLWLIGAWSCGPLACLGPEPLRFMMLNSRDGSCVKRWWSLCWPTKSSSPRWNRLVGSLRSVSGSPAWLKTSGMNRLGLPIGVLGSAGSLGTHHRAFA